MNVPSRHIFHRYDEELAHVHRQVVDMGDVVIEQLEKLLVAIRQRDSALAYGVTKRETRVNRMEVAADTEIFLLVAKRCPVASDLRLVMAASKTVTHLERTGDEVAKVANVLLEQLQQENVAADVADGDPISEIGEATLAALRAALESFRALDFAAARQLLIEQKKPHLELDDTMRDLMTRFEKGPPPVNSLVSQILMSKSLDRIKDLAIEIAENVIMIGDDDRGSD